MRKTLSFTPLSLSTSETLHSFLLISFYCSIKFVTIFFPAIALSVCFTSSRNSHKEFTSFSVFSIFTPFDIQINKKLNASRNKFIHSAVFVLWIEIYSRDIIILIYIRYGSINRERGREKLKEINAKSVFDVRSQRSRETPKKFFPLAGEFS